MNKKFKKFAAIILIMAMTAALSSCSGKKAGSDVTSAPTADVNAAPTEALATAAPEPTDVPDADATQAPDATGAPVVTDAPEAAGDPIFERRAELDDEEPYDEKNPQNIEITLGSDYDSDWNPDVSAVYGWYSYDYPVLTDYYADRYPLLAAAFDDYHQSNEAFTDEVLEDLRQAADLDEIYGDYNREQHLKVIRADSNLVCLQYNYYGYSGGAHGYYGTMGLCWDPMTGSKLGLKDLVKDKDAFIQKVYDTVISTLEPDDIFEDDLLGYIRNSYEDDLLSFEVGYNYFSVIFNPYEISSYAMGKINADIPFKGNEGLFVEKYLYAPDNYMFWMNEDTIFRSDLNDDGTVDEICIFRNYVDEYEDFNAVGFYFNAKESRSSS